MPKGIKRLESYTESNSESNLRFSISPSMTIAILMTYTVEAAEKAFDV